MNTGQLTNGASANNDIYDDGYIRVEHNNFYFSCGSKPIFCLTRKEFLVLSCLARAAGRPVSHLALWEYAWGGGTEYNKESCRVCISTLRRKLAPYGLEIINVVHFGYRLARNEEE